MEFHEFDPASLTSTDRYKLLIGGITPRPIGFISTVNAAGQANIAPYSFFQGVGSDPMMLLFCPVNNPDGTEKDSLRNSKPASEGGLGEFVANVAMESYIHLVAAAGEGLPHGESEFDLTGLTPAPSKMVRAPRLLESPVAYECRTHSVIRTNPASPAGGNIVLAEVVHVWVRDDVLGDRLNIRQDAGFVGRMGGPDYCRTVDRFSLPRGREAIHAPLASK